MLWSSNSCGSRPCLSIPLAELAGLYIQASGGAQHLFLVPDDAAAAPQREVYAQQLIKLFPPAGLIVLPPAVHVPGGPDAPSAGSPPDLRKVAFATGGELGRVRLWRADTAQCIYPEGPAREATLVPAGSEITGLELGGDGELMACTGDCRIFFHDLKVRALQPAVANLEHVPHGSCWQAPCGSRHLCLL